MNRNHPRDRILEQYRNRSLTDREAEVVELHLNGCSDCRARLESAEALDRYMKELPIEQPSAEFADSLMAKLSSIPIVSHSQGDGQENRRRKAGLLRPELANALVATAATYLFVSSGIVKAVFNLDPGAVEYSLYERVTTVMDWVDKLTRSIPS